MSVAVVNAERLVSCDICEKAIPDGKSVCCLKCLKKRIDKEVEEAEAEWTTEISADNLRAWAQRQKVMGRMTPEVFAALEQAADDIEQGWPP